MAAWQTSLLAALPAPAPPLNSSDEPGVLPPALWLPPPLWPQLPSASPDALFPLRPLGGDAAQRTAVATAQQRVQSDILGAHAAEALVAPLAREAAELAGQLIGGGPALEAHAARCRAAHAAHAFTAPGRSRAAVIARRV